MENPRKKRAECKTKLEDCNPSEYSSGSRRTRSQKAAPDWSLTDCLILVNEIAAVEADCSKALSTYQKWKIIAENCTALDVPRNSNQCRRKWDSLLAEYKSRASSSRTKKLGKSENFDEDLSKSIDHLVRAREGEPDTDPDSDPEAAAEMVDEMPEPASKRRRRRIAPQKCWSVDREPTKTESFSKEKALINTEDCKEEKERSNNIEEEEQQIMATKLLETTEMIRAIVTDNIISDSEHPSSSSTGVDGKSVSEEQQIASLRSRGDKLISCLGDFLNTLNQFSDLVH